MPKQIVLLIFCSLAFLSSITTSYARPFEKQTVQAMLTLNIAKFTSWPEETFTNTESSLNVCVFGDNIIQESFAKLDNKVVHKRNIKITRLSRLRNIQQCQILYISKLERNRLFSLLAEIKNKPILTIGENIDFLKAGGIVGLESKQGKIQLNINLARLKQTELVISSRLLKLAKIINYPRPILKPPE